MYPLLRFCVSCAHHAFALYSSVVRSQSAFASSPCSSSSHRAVTHPVSNLVAPRFSAPSNLRTLPTPPSSPAVDASFSRFIRRYLFFRHLLLWCCFFCLRALFPAFAPCPPRSTSSLALGIQPSARFSHWSLPSTVPRFPPSPNANHPIYIKAADHSLPITPQPRTIPFSSPLDPISRSDQITSRPLVLSSWDRRSNRPSRICRVCLPFQSTIS